jgi:hypothetical protein
MTRNNHRIARDCSDCFSLSQVVLVTQAFQRSRNVTHIACVQLQPQRKSMAGTRALHLTRPHLILIAAPKSVATQLAILGGSFNAARAGGLHSCSSDGIFRCMQSSVAHSLCTPTGIFMRNGRSHVFLASDFKRVPFHKSFSSMVSGQG